MYVVLVPFLLLFSEAVRGGECERKTASRHNQRRVRERLHVIVIFHSCKHSSTVGSAVTSASSTLRHGSFPSAPYGTSFFCQSLMTQHSWYNIRVRTSSFSSPHYYRLLFFVKTPSQTINDLSQRSCFVWSLQC